MAFFTLLAISVAIQHHLAPVYFSNPALYQQIVSNKCLQEAGPLGVAIYTLLIDLLLLVWEKQKHLGLCIRYPVVNMASCSRCQFTNHGSFLGSLIILVHSCMELQTSLDEVKRFENRPIRSGYEVTLLTAQGACDPNWVAQKRCHQNICLTFFFSNLCTVANCLERLTEQGRVEVRSSNVLMASSFCQSASLDWRILSTVSSISTCSFSIDPHLGLTTSMPR